MQVEFWEEAKPNVEKVTHIQQIVTIICMFALHLSFQPFLSSSFSRAAPPPHPP